MKFIKGLMNREKRGEAKIEQKSNKLEELIPKPDFRDGILITEEEYIAFIEVMPVNFKLKSDREQLYIIDRYEELLKKIKAPFYMFTISKKADAKAHLDYITEEMVKETNTGVQNLMEEYMEYVKTISFKNAVKRRFIVAIPYQGIPGVKVNFNDARQWLMQKCTSFVEAIDKCGNDAVISIGENNRFAAEIVYEQLNPKCSEREGLPKL